jgi:hypothetical protein
VTRSVRTAQAGLETRLAVGTAGFLAVAMCAPNAPSTKGVLNSVTMPAASSAAFRRRATPTR